MVASGPDKAILFGLSTDRTAPSGSSLMQLSLTFLLSLIDLEAVHKEHDNHVVSARHRIPRLIVPVLDKIT